MYNNPIRRTKFRFSRIFIRIQEHIFCIYGKRFILYHIKIKFVNINKARFLEIILTYLQKWTNIQKQNLQNSI